MTSPLRTLLLIADVLTALHLLAGGASGQVYRCEVPVGQRVHVGSCVCIGEFAPGEWLFITNEHVVDRGTQPRIKLDQWETASVLGKRGDKQTDIAVLSLRHRGDIRYAPLAMKNPSVGTSVIAKGFAQGKYRERRTRIVAYRPLRVEGRSISGESGGAIIDPSTGDVVGIISGNLEGRSPTVGDDAERIRRFITSTRSDAPGLVAGSYTRHVRLANHRQPADTGKRDWLYMVGTDYCGPCRQFSKDFLNGKSNFGRLLLSRYKVIGKLDANSRRNRQWLANQNIRLRAVPIFVDSTGNVARGYRGQQWLLAALDIRATDVESPGGCDTPAPRPPKTKPEPRIQPTTPVADRDCCDCESGEACDCDLTALADSIKKNRELIRTIQKQPGPQGPPGERGPRGPQGERGPAGPPGADGKSVDRDAVIGELTAYIDRKYADRDGYDDSELRAAIARLEKRINELAAREPESGTVTIVIREDGEELYRLEGVKMGSRVDVPIERYVEEDK